jgi:hypothetical protein
VLVAVAVVAAAVAYAVVASYTRPFAAGADTVTAIPLAVAAIAVAARLRTARVSDISPSDRDPDPPTGSTRWSRLWSAAAVVALSWELYCYSGTPRSDHPTLSTLIDLLDSTRIGKITGFALWLALGWYLVWR